MKSLHNLFLLQSVVEKVVYTVSEENPQWTVAQRSAWIDSSVFGFSRPLQAFGLDRFKKNCLQMTNGFNYVLAHMFPQTAQFMNPNLIQMGFSEKVKIYTLNFINEQRLYSLISLHKRCCILICVYIFLYTAIIYVVVYSLQPKNC